MNKKKSNRILSMILVFVFLILSVSCESGGSAVDMSKTESDTQSIPTAVYSDIIKDGKTDYVIVYNSKDKVSRALAYDIGDQLRRIFGVSPMIRSDSEEYEYEIIVGKTSHSQSVAASTRMNGKDDFLIQNYEKSLILYAETMKAATQLEIVLRDLYFAVEDTSNLSLPVGNVYIESEQGSHSVANGAYVDLLSNGVSEYTIVYPQGSSDESLIGEYLQSAIRKAFGKRPKMNSDSKGAVECEILIGSTARKESRTAKSKLLESENDFVVRIDGSKVVILGTDIGSTLWGAEYFITNILSQTDGGLCRFYEGQAYRYAMDGRGSALTRERMSELYADVLNRYPTLYEYYWNTGVISEASKADQTLIEALIERMADSAVFCVGSSNVLHKGMIEKLDPSDYSRTVTVENGNIFVPAPFANAYFSTAENVMVCLNTTCVEKEYGLDYDPDTGLVIVTPKNVASFVNGDETDGKYTNEQYTLRMEAFFTEDALWEPSTNTEQSRVVIDTQYDYPEDALDYKTVTNINCYSPSILSTQDENGDTVLYASYELCSVEGSYSEVATKTVIRKSKDGGLTWQQIAVINELRWGDLFLVGETVYLMGCMRNTGNTLLVRVNKDDTVYSKSLFYYGCSGPHENLIADGILYVPYDTYGVHSIPITEDLFDLSKWTSTEAVFKNSKEARAWFSETSGHQIGSGAGTAMNAEGNMIFYNGEVYVMYRLESQPYGNYALLMKVSKDRENLLFLENGESLVALPTTVSKFNIKYDESSGLYLCISNLWTVESNCRARNVLGLSVSSDMINWTVVDTLLIEREMMNAECSSWLHAYQYPDWDFDGDDIVMVIREATGFCNHFHDGRYCTFYRISDFRKLIVE